MSGLGTIAAWIGLLLTMIAWVPQSLQCLRGKPQTSCKFLILTCAGSIFLGLYAATRHDWPFILLNTYAAANAALCAALRRYDT